MAGRLFEEVSGTQNPQKVIVELRPVPRDPNMRQVIVGRRCMATLRALDVDSLKLRVGQAWNDTLALRVQHVLAVHKARKVAMNMIAKRPFSRNELVERLNAKGHEPSICQQISRELEEDGWIDERAYAHALIHGLTRSKPASDHLIKQKLAARKIKAEVTAAVIDEYFPKHGSVAAAEAYARSKLDRSSSKSKLVNSRRIAGLLARRGFDEGVIETVLDRLKLSRSDDVHDA